MSLAPGRRPLEYAPETPPLRPPFHLIGCSPAMTACRLHLPDLAAVDELGAAIAREARIGDILALSGDLGAGKTTLAPASLAHLGLMEDALRPTLALVLTYDAPPLRLPVWHADLYRLAEPDEAVEHGVDEAFDTALSLIDWPERMG